MVRSRNSCSKTKRSFSSITLLVFHGMRLFYTQLPKFPQCQGCSRSILSGMCPVRTRGVYYPPPRGFNCLCPTPYPLSPFFSNTCALFCISLHFFLRLPKTQLISFQAIPRSLQ